MTTSTGGKTADGLTWADVDGLEWAEVDGLVFGVDSWIIEARQVHVPGWESAQAHIAGAEELDGHGQ
jgi:hypothetical protein